MTEAEKARALEADRVLNDDTITEALDAMRRGGLEQLLKVDPADQKQIMQLQAYVAAVDAFRGQLSIYVSQGTERKPRGDIA